MVVHHTECALGRLSQAEIAQRITEATGLGFSEDVGTFSDPIQAIVEDVNHLRRHPSLAHRDKIRGFMYDLLANAVTEVPSPQPSA